jgi:hypothetical protein
LVGFFAEKESHVDLDDTCLEVLLQLTTTISSPVRCVTHRRLQLESQYRSFFKFNICMPSVLKKFFSSPERL